MLFETLLKRIMNKQLYTKKDNNYPLGKILLLFIPV